MRTIRIGSGAGYGGDRIEPAIGLIRRGDLDYIIFECLAERTVSIAQARRRQNPELGYNDLFDYRFTRILDTLGRPSCRKQASSAHRNEHGRGKPRCRGETLPRHGTRAQPRRPQIACVTGDDKTMSSTATWV